MLAAAMRQHRFFFRHRIFAESPRNRFGTAASRLFVAKSKIPIRNLASVSRGGAVGTGVLQRIGYGSVGCVVPAASSRRAGVVFGDNRRIGHPGFGTISSRCRAPCAHLSRRPSRGVAPPPLSSLPARRTRPPTRRTRLALEARRGAHADAWSLARLCHNPCQPLSEFRRRHVLFSE